MVRWAILGAVVLSLFWSESAFAPAACGTPGLPPPRIAASTGQVSFTIQESGGTQSQDVGLTDVGATSSWSGSADSSGWLSISPGASGAMSASASDSVTLTASPGSLSAGTYGGSVTITPSACGATGSPTTISASLTVVAQPNVAISASGGVNLTAGSPPQTVNITVTRTNYTGAVTLAVNGLPNLVTATITQPGTGNSGSIALSAAANAAAVSNVSIGVVASGNGVSSSGTSFRLTVTAGAPVLAVSATSLNFSAATGVAPASQTFLVQNTGAGALGWSATVTGPFSISPATGVAPTTVTVTPTAQSQAGNYSGTVTVTALPSAGATGSPKTVQLTLAVGIPSVPQGGIVSGATFNKEAVVGANGIASLFGTGLASGTFAADRIPLPTTLGTTQVLVNDVPASLFFVSAGQINFQVPWNFLGLTSVNAVVVNGSVRSTPVSVTLRDTVPGIFTLNNQGTGQGAIQIANTTTFAAPAGSVPGANAQPVPRGGFITIYCTGLGDVNDRPANGAASAGQTTKASPTVSIGGVASTVTFSGLAPGFVALYQVNVQVPSNAPTGGAVQLVLTIGGASSNTVTIAVQ